MLAELRVKELGVIADLTLVLGPGLIALTGETGTGKTLVVEAIELLLGGRADPVLVRPGAPEAVIEGRFIRGDNDSDEVVVTRTIPVSGRSRAYINGRMAPLAALEEAVGRLVDLHGQHSHQSLLSPAAQRLGLDAFGGIDLAPMAEARRRLRQAETALAELGGDAATRARELDMLRFQANEIAAAVITSPQEDLELAAQEEQLANARAHREAAEEATVAVSGDGGVIDALGGAVAALAGHPPLANVHHRLRVAAIELADVGSELRAVLDGLEDDPGRLAHIRERRQLLRQLQRKYGETLDDVLAFADQARGRQLELESFEQRAEELDGQRGQAARDLAASEAAVGAQRRSVAPRLAAAIQGRMRNLAMPQARLEVVVGDDRAGEEVTWLLGANPGEPSRPLAKVASGGELARTMLAVRLVLSTAGPPGTGDGDAAAVGATLVFDEVDAGIGGEAALAVGRALADLAAEHQVLVVTHLPQVAAFADQQIAVEKRERGGRTVASIRPLSDAERVVELSRMLSGQPDSDTARRHAQELLTLAQAR